MHDTRIVPLSVVAGVVMAAVVGASVAQAGPAPSDVMPIADVKPGMKGYGLTVFAGTTPERFDIEIISTLHNFRPNQDLFLIKTPHPRLDIAHTVAGMSGSPIYLNDKMIGAYSYGWIFGSEPIAGVTPIQYMLDELARPIPKELLPGAGGAPLPGGVARPAKKPGGRQFTGAIERYDLGEHAKQLAAFTQPTIPGPDGAAVARASTPIMVGGSSPAALRVLQDALGPAGLDVIQAGGSGATGRSDAPTKFVDGGAVGVELVRGDVSAMGLGTVTKVQGDRLVAFGHPMLNGGIEALPTAIGRVHWIMATQNRSFKIGESARSMGALINDRPTAIVVDSTVKAPVFPVNVVISGVDGAPKPNWAMEVSGDPFMGPMFAAMAIGSAVETTMSERRDMTWRALSTLKIAGHGAITLPDFAAGSGNPPGAEDFARGRLIRALGALMSNPWEDVTVESIDTKIDVVFRRDMVLLRGVRVLEPEIDAGQPAHLELELEGWQKKTLEKKIIEVPMPPELAGRGDIEIELAPGYEVERPMATPDSVAELMALFQNASFDFESVVVSFRIPRESGAAYHGKVATRLPPGAADTLRPTSSSDSPEPFASQIEIAVPLKKFLVGHDTVRVEVRPVLR